MGRRRGNERNPNFDKLAMHEVVLDLRNLKLDSKACYDLARKEA